MLPCTGDFKTAIKAQARDVNVVICYKIGDSYVFLQKDNIQSLTFNAKADKCLGGVVKKVLDAKVMYNENTANLTRGTVINLYYKCGAGNCKKALLYINSVKVNKAHTIITLEAMDLFSYDKTNKPMPIMKNVSLVDYEKAIFEALDFKHTIDSDVVNPTLSLGYPKSGKVGDTLATIAEANNALIDFEDIVIYQLTLPFTLPATFSIPCVNEWINPGLEARLHVKKFAFKEPFDIIDEDTEVIDFEIDDDNSNQFNDVKVNLFFPSDGEQKSLGTVKATVPGGTLNYNIGTIDFGNTVIPQMCVFDGMIDIADFAIGSDSLTLKVNNSSPNAVNIEASILGLDISETTLKNTDTDNNVKQISNMYIQSASVYDTNIFKYPNCTIKTFGNPLYEVGDTVRCGEYDVLILEENLVFQGGLKSTLKGVARKYETD